MNDWDKEQQKQRLKKRGFWDQISDFVSRDDVSAHDFQEEDNLRVAVSSLLVHMARSDESFHEKEYHKIISFLSARFDLDEAEAEQFVKRGFVEQESAIDLHSFVRVVNRNLNQEERQEVVRSIWMVILADGVIDKFEDALIRKMCNLLGVSQHDSVRIRDQILETL